MLETTAPLPVREALAAAKFILQAGHGSHDVVLDSTGYSDVMAAVLAATSSTHHPVAGITYETVVLEATYDCHGAHLVPGQAFASPDGTYTTVIVAIRAAHPVDDRTRTPLVASVAADLRRMEADLGVYAAERVFVVLQPGAEPAARMVDALGTPVAVGDAVAVATYDPEVRAVTIERTVVSSIRADLGQWIEVVLDGRTEVIESSEIVRLG